MNTQSTARATDKVDHSSADRGFIGMFDALYRSLADPYGVRSRWYEQRKIAVLLASLPRARFAGAYEPACGTGELTARLAERCDDVLASDLSAFAVAAAIARTRELPNVHVAQHRLPQDFPTAPGAFDLVVLSEVTSFMTIPEIGQVAQHCLRGLSDRGILVLCDWLPDFEGRASQAASAHAVFDAAGLSKRVAHMEEDFLLQLWTK